MNFNNLVFLIRFLIDFLLQNILFDIPFTWCYDFFPLDTFPIDIFRAANSKSTSCLNVTFCEKICCPFPGIEKIKTKNKKLN